jgi:chemotaxis family two-component system response regulator Rcp1
MIVEAINILLVEDNPADAYLTKANFESLKIAIELHHVEDGIEAMDYLHQRGSHADAERPDLILLDLNMPRKDGREVLEEIKKDASLCSIPVVVLTSSQAEVDIVKSYKLQANAYVTKPVGLEAFGEIVQGIEKFWLSVVRFPPKKAERQD